MMLSAETGVPTSVDFVRCDPSQLVVSYCSCNTYIFDIETGKEVLMLETRQNCGEHQSSVGGGGHLHSDQAHAQRTSGWARAAVFAPAIRARLE